MNEIIAPHALIIGGGIAGPLAGLGLARIGVSSTIYEAYPAGDAGGAWMTVAVNGLAAMRELGVHAAAQAAGFPSEIIELYSGTGKRLGAVPIGGRLDDGTVTHTVKRTDLCRCLADAARAQGIAVEHGKRLVDLDQDASGVTARFADGTTARGSVLIAADGVHSRVRGLIDPAAPTARYTGMGNLGGFAPGAAAALTRGDAYRMVFGKRAFFGYVAAPGGDVWWFANPPSERELAREDLAATDWRARLIYLFEDDRGPMLDLVRATPGKLTCANQYDVARVPTWQRGRVVLIGDAAHAASPSSGQGVSMAAEDAVALAACITAHGPSTAALAAFVAARRARTERVVAHGRRFAATKTAGPVGRVIRDLVLPHVFKRQEKSSGRESMAWLYQHREPAAQRA